MQHAALFCVTSGARIFAASCTLALALYAAHAHADAYSDVQHLVSQGQSNEALAKADAYIAGKPRDPQMRFLRGVILTEQGKQTEAVQAFTQLTQEFPELPEPYNNLAALYAAQGKFDQARTALETAIRLNPNYATAHENLGDVYLRLAAQSYSRAQQFEPRNAGLGRKVRVIRELTAPKPAAEAAPPTTK